MAAEKHAGVQACLGVAQGIAGDVAAVAQGVDHRGAVLALHQQNVVHVDEGHALLVVEHQPAGGGAGRSLGRDGQGGFLVYAADAVAGALQGLQHTIHLEGLDQVVEGIDLKGVAHVLVVGGGEDHHNGGIHVLNDAAALHAGLAGHFHVQENDLRAQFLHHVQQLFAVLSLAHQLEALHLFDHAPLDQAHSLIVVRNNHTNGFHLYITPF